MSRPTLPVSEPPVEREPEYRVEAEFGTLGPGLQPPVASESRVGIVEMVGERDCGGRIEAGRGLVVMTLVVKARFAAFASGRTLGSELCPPGASMSSASRCNANNLSSSSVCLVFV